MYMNLRQAFLFESLVGCVSFALVLSIGQSGIIAILLLVLMPVLSERKSEYLYESLCRLYYGVSRMSAIFIVLAFVIAYAGPELNLIQVHESKLTITLIYFLFFIVHGFTGFILSPKT